METLSDKIIPEIKPYLTYQGLKVKDVKEFIRELKEIFYAGNSHMRIDKLAGDKLIWKSNAITANTSKITKARCRDILVLIVDAKSI